MTSLIDFLTARLDEDEAAALAWPEDQRDWTAAGKRYLTYASGCGEQMGAVNVGGDYYGWERIYIKSDLDADLSAYLTRHDPARVLREVAAKRKIIEAAAITIGIYSGSTLRDFAIETLRRLASTWDDHPDYDQEWRPFGEAYREEWKP